MMSFLRKKETEVNNYHFLDTEGHFYVVSQSQSSRETIRIDIGLV
jgi:hypothetical protein